MAFDLRFFYRRVELDQYTTSQFLETELPRHLTVIGTVAANIPYLGVLITAMGIMLTFHPMRMDSGAPRS